MCWIQYTELVWPRGHMDHAPHTGLVHHMSSHVMRSWGWHMPHRGNLGCILHMVHLVQPGTDTTLGPCSGLTYRARVTMCCLHCMGLEPAHMLHTVQGTCSMQYPHWTSSAHWIQLIDLVFGPSPTQRSTPHSSFGPWGLNEFDIPEGREKD